MVFAADGQIIVPEDGATAAQANAQGSYSCRDAKITVRRGHGFTIHWKLESKTNFCYDGDALAHRDPRFKFRGYDMGVGVSMVNTTHDHDGEVGDWEHEDWVQTTFQRCLPVVGCTGADTVKIEKWQTGDGLTRDRVKIN